MYVHTHTNLAEQRALRPAQRQGPLHTESGGIDVSGTKLSGTGLALTFPLLSPSFSAGCVALPALINIKAVIEQRQCTGVWNQKDELPVSSIFS